jgi:CBS domain-containing protein
MPRLDLATRHVRDVMTFHAVFVSPGDTVTHALEVMNDNRVASLPVVDDANRCLGMLSASDILTLAEERGADIERMSITEGIERELLLEHFGNVDFSDTLVDDLMTPLPFDVAPEASLVEAAKRMIESDVHHLVVTERRDQFLGILSSMDIVRAVAESE